jgi:hypothetical protein
MISRRNMLKLAGLGAASATGAIALRHMPLSTHELINPTAIECGSYVKSNHSGLQ